MSGVDLNQLRQPEGMEHVANLCVGKHGGVYVPQAHCYEPAYLRPLRLGWHCGDHGDALLVPVYAFSAALVSAERENTE